MELELAGFDLPLAIDNARTVVREPNRQRLCPQGGGDGILVNAGEEVRQASWRQDLRRELNWAKDLTLSLRCPPR